MSSERQDPARLIQYLLGSLPDVEAERLDELSVTDEEFAWRLGAAENDLVDAYVRGELSGETLERFETHYLSSPKRREKVRFARALGLVEERSAISSESAVPEATPLRHFPGPLPVAPRRVPAWALALAALLLLLPAGYLLLANARLRQELSRAESQRASLEGRTRTLQRQLELQPAQVRADRKAEGGAGAAEPLARPQVLSILLLPQTRGLGQVATLRVPPGTQAVTLQLQLESDDFPGYAVALKSAANGRTIWRSGKVHSVSGGDGRTVTVTVPAALLTPGHFSAELSGVTSSGATELLGGYAFQAVLR